ncbi:MAG: FAD-binding oxidoreductase [Flavobacteriales bacterium]|nr:FAD-binding oxidoreductase [Flavobacteriales bacterium]
MSATHTHDALIIGQGLAGVVLSEALVAQGRRVAVFDVPKAGRSSLVAAGLVNPLVLRRTVPSWRAMAMLDVTVAFYHELEARYGARFWHPLPVVGLFPSPHEAELWEKRLADPEVAPFLDREPSEDHVVRSFPQPHGHGVVKHGAWLDIPTMLSIHRQRWVTAGDLVEREVKDSDIRRFADGVEVLGFSAPMLVHCAGPFAAVPGLVPVRGEGLTVRIPGLDLESAVHRKVFILPIGNDVYKVGATFAWTDVWSGPTAEARRWLSACLEELIDRPYQVLEHWAGVRPAARDRRPILGRTGAHEAVFNGLGSRGVLLAPWSAQHLSDQLFRNASVDPEVDPARFS